MKRFFFFLASFLYATIFTFGQCDHNLLLNSDFESSIRAGDNWVPTAQADISNDARSGQQAMRIDASPFVRIWQVFPATPGQEYTFSGYLKTTGAGGGIAISFLTADYQPNFEFLEFEPSNTYNKIELTRTAHANTAWIQVLFIASPDAPLFADDFCLVEGDGSSSNCTISATVSNLFCNDAGTSEDPSDDEYGFDLEVSSTNGGPTFDFIVPSLNINIPRVYGSMPVNENKISDGIKTIILRDSSVPNCETTINVTPPATCSGGQAELTIIGEPCPTNFPKQQQTVSVDFTIKNTGTIVSTAETIYLYRNAMGRQSNALQIGEVEVPSLAPNQQVNLTVSGVDNSPIPGSYLTTPGRPFTEYLGYFLSNERAQFPNNLKEIDYYCKKFNTDLALEITPVETGYDDSGEISFRLKLSNNGNEGASNIAVNFFEPLNLNNTSLNNILLSPDNINFQSTSNGVQWVSLFITPGGYTETTITTRFTELLQLSSVPDNFIVNATVTSGHNLNTNTSNDSVSATFVKRGSQGGDGNLVLTATGDSNIPQWSDGVAYFEITNRSGETFDNIQVRFDFDQNIRLMGGNQYTSSAGTTLEQSWTRNPVWNVGTIGAGGVKNVALNVYSITNSPMEIYAQISQATGNDVTSTPGNGTPPIVNEDDEVLWQINGGNQSLPELVVRNFRLGSSTVKNGEILTYAFDVANIGDGDVLGEFTIKSYISTDNILSADDIQDGMIQTGNFTAGTTSRDVLGGVTIPSDLPEGDYYLLLKVDADVQVAESNEDNNVVLSRFKVDEMPPIGPSCGVRISSIAGRFNCIEEEFGNIKVVYDSANHQIAKLYTPDLDLLSTQVFSPADLGRSRLEWENSTLTKQRSDGSIAFQKAVPQILTNQLNIPIEAIEFANGYVFFGWEDLDLSDTISVGDKFSAIRTDADFNILNQNSLFEFTTRYDEISFNYFTVVDDSNIMYINRYRAGFTFVELQVLDENLNFVQGINLTNGLSNVGGSLSESACGTYSYNGTAFPLCGSGFCVSSNGGDFTIEGDSINVNLSYSESYSYLSSGSGSNSSSIVLITSDGGKLTSSKTVGFGGQLPLNDNFRTFNKFDSNGNLQWQKIVEFSNAISLRRMFELNGEFYLVRGRGITKFECLDNPTPPSTGVDLELSYNSLNAYSPAQWSFFSNTLTLTNTGTQAANGVEVELKRADEAVYKGGDEFTSSQGDFQHWGDEIWRVGDLAAGQSATITINYYRLSANGFSMYAQINSLNETDSDSTPGNGNCCTANEDDEAVLQIGNSARGVNNRSAIAENLGNEVFAIVGANPNPTTGRFNIEVYSNENQISEMTIVDILGRPIFRKEVNLNEGHNSIPIELENGNAGMMVVKMTPFHPYLRQVRVIKVRD